MPETEVNYSLEYHDSQCWHSVTPPQRSYEIALWQYDYYKPYFGMLRLTRITTTREDCTPGGHNEPSQTS